MTFDTIAGIVIAALALIAVVCLTLWSRRVIERIHVRSPSSLREIQKEIIDGDKS